jgi:hypothetical protein
MLCYFQGTGLLTHDCQLSSEQPQLLRFEIRQAMTVIVKPSCYRIAAEHHEFPDVRGIGRLVVSHEDLTGSLPHNLNLTGSM